MRFAEFVESNGGSILVVLSVFLVGVWLALAGHEPIGAPIITGAGTSLYTLLRSKPTQSQRPTQDNPNDGSRTD